MATQLERTRLVDGIRALVDRFQGRLAGPRQVTRKQMVRFLAGRLGYPEEAAGRLFDELQAEGVILRREERTAEGLAFRGDNRQWAIDVDRSDGLTERIEPPVVFVEEQPEPKALELLRIATRHRATDVHLDPYDDEVEIRFRIDGRLEHYGRLDAPVGRQLMSQFKVLANLDPVEPFHAHEGRLHLPPDLHDIDVRITTVPVAGGEAVALRLLSHDQIIRPLSGLGFTDDGITKLRAMVGDTEGLVLIVGPSGAGKTTTLYSLLHDLDDGSRNIVSIEDPVEYLVPQFLQIEVDRRHGRTPADGLKTVLRMDADMILLGEIRDRETAVAAIGAAGCGKHVLSTLHARDAAAAVTVLRQLGLDDRTISTTLRGIVAQRLVRRVCTHCRNTRPPTDADGGLFTDAKLAPPENLAIPVGCERCRGTGYEGRIGVFEIAPLDGDLAEAVADGEPESELRLMLREKGTESLRTAALRTAAAGLSTVEEAQAACSSE